MANSVEPDQIPHPVESDQALHGLLRLVCPNTRRKYGSYKCFITFELALDNDLGPVIRKYAEIFC